MSSIDQVSSDQIGQLWSNLKAEFETLLPIKEKTDGYISRVNKAHTKVENRGKSKESFTVNAGNRLQEIYNTFCQQATRERTSIDAILLQLDALIEKQEVLERDASDLKRKSETINEQAKRQKLGQVGISFLIGDQVAAKVGTEWILASVIGMDPISQTVEIEDIEEDDEHPGLRRKYTVDTKHTIPIVTDVKHEEFKIGSEILALYPASSCFYKAKIVKTPSQVSLINKNAPESTGYIVLFEDDGGFERLINPSMVLELPGAL